MATRKVDIDVLWNFDDPQGSEIRFRALAEEAQTQIARTLGLQRKFGDGHAVLDGVNASNDRVRVRFLLERGRLFNSAGDKNQARPLFIEAYNLAKSVGEDALEVDSAHMLAIVANGDEAREWNERALERAVESEDPKAGKWHATLLNNLGWSYHAAGDFPKALGLFEEARIAREEMGQVRPERIARWCVARCLRSLGRFDEALAMQLQIQTETVGDGFCEEELGENLLALGKSEEAKPFFKEALEKLSRDPWLVENEAYRLARLQQLAEG